MEIVSTEKNRDTGAKEVLVRLSFDEVQFVKGAVNMYKDDIDDPKIQETAENVRRGFLECKNALRP